MKKAMLLIPAILIGTLFTGCGQNDTELGFVNGTGTEVVNDIVWADGDQTWSSPNGYNPGDSTGTKNVMQTSGSVDGKVDAGGGNFVTANIIFNTPDGPSNALSLNDGESQVYTIDQANP